MRCLFTVASFLRGEHRPAVCFFVKTLDGTAVGVAASVAENPPNSAEARSAWWGMLATDVMWRGRGIATHLGAMALVAMAERHGIQSFSTGIRSGHADSIKLFTILRLSPTGLVDLLAIDPVTMSGAPVEN